MFKRAYCRVIGIHRLTKGAADLPKVFNERTESFGKFLSQFGYDQGVFDAFLLPPPMFDCS